MFKEKSKINLLGQTRKCKSREKIAMIMRRSQQWLPLAVLFCLCSSFSGRWSFSFDSIFLTAFFTTFSYFVCRWLESGSTSPPSTCCWLTALNSLSFFLSSLDRQFHFSGPFSASSLRSTRKTSTPSSRSCQLRSMTQRSTTASVTIQTTLRFIRLPSRSLLKIQSSIALLRFWSFSWYWHVSWANYKLFLQLCNEFIITVAQTFFWLYSIAFYRRLKAEARLVTKQNERTSKTL